MDIYSLVAESIVMKKYFTYEGNITDVFFPAYYKV